MKKIAVFLALLFLMAGCSTFRKAAIKVSEQDLKNYETKKVVAQNYLKTWPMESGIIRGALGANLNQLPNEAVTAMDELDELAMQTEFNDHDLGYSLGLRVRMLNKIVLEALQMYAPNVFDLLNALPI